MGVFYALCIRVSGDYFGGGLKKIVVEASCHIIPDVVIFFSKAEKINLI